MVALRISDRPKRKPTYIHPNANIPKPREICLPFRRVAHTPRHANPDVQRCRNDAGWEMPFSIWGGVVGCAAAGGTGGVPIDGSGLARLPDKKMSNEVL